ncbi:MAG: transcription termination factor NusA [Candidatus Bipolaricaulia bacterium]
MDEDQRVLILIYGAVSPVNIEFLEALEEMAKEQGIAREDLYRAIEAGLTAAYTEQFGEPKALEVLIDKNSGDIQLLVQEGKQEKQRRQVRLRDFGRVATKIAEQTIRQEILKIKRQIIYEKYRARIGELINGSVHRFDGGNVWLNLGEAEALLPDRERIPGERYRQGARLKAYLYDVEQTQGDPRILVSRTQPGFVERLLELEVPELADGLLVVKAIAREAGRRTKVAVQSLDEEIEPVGTSVGSGGSRIKAVIQEISGEKIDVVRWSDNIEELITHSLEPASVLSIELDEENKAAKVLVPDDELSLAIGKGGQNVRLTVKLTGYNIDVTSPVEELEAEAKAAHSGVESGSEAEPESESES